MRYFLNISLIVLVVIYSFACCSGSSEDKSTHDGKHDDAEQPTTSTGNFGANISADNAVAAAELPALLEGNEYIETKLIGEIEAVCQMSGCWIDIAMNDGEVIHVTFKDDKFILPKDAAGKTAILEGVGTFEEIPVSMLKHIAEDEGRSQEEIDAITEPILEYTFVAEGVIIQD